MRLLIKTVVPSWHAAPEGLLASATWYTWSPQTRSILCSLKSAASHFPPELVRLHGSGEYGLSYVCQARILRQRSLRAALRALADAFYDVRLPRKGLIFLRGLIDDTVSPADVQFLFSALVTLSTRVRDCQILGALSPPIQPALPLESAFRLHADLFPQSMLMTIFDDVPIDGTGACVLLMASRMRRLVREVADMHPTIVRRLYELQTKRQEDTFDEFFDLLYGRHPWKDALSRRLEANMETLALRRGEGYLLDDRLWLHGRTAQSRRVTTSRLYRLIFSSRGAALR